MSSSKIFCRLGAIIQDIGCETRAAISRNDKTVETEKKITLSNIIRDAHLYYHVTEDSGLLEV